MNSIKRYFAHCLCHFSIAPKIIGFFVILFFLAKPITEKHIKAPDITKIMEPKSILAFKVKSPDRKYSEEWFRICNNVNRDLQGVYAFKTDSAPYLWSLSFDACELVREKIFVSILQDVTQTLKKLPG